MNKTFNLLFNVKKSKVNALGESPIYLRIRVDGKITEISTKRSIIPSKWNAIAQRLNGTSEAIKSLNSYLKSFEQKVYDAYHFLLKEKDKPSCED